MVLSFHTLILLFHFCFFCLAPHKVDDAGGGLEITFNRANSNYPFIIFEEKIVPLYDPVLYPIYCNS
jgi:hypothetical protein